MRITLIDAGKRFNRDWIFRHLSYEFTQGHSYAITGPNGSGKSTLLQSIAGAIAISEGAARYENAQAIPPDEVYRHLALAAPYLDLIEEMTVTEFLRFHHSFKPFLSSCSIEFIIDRMGLAAAAHKQIRYYSSGMKQRVKLAQAIFSDTPVLLLDEPCTNLDTEGIDLYRRLIAEFTANRLVVVSSNDIQEYDFCEKTLSIADWRSAGSNPYISDRTAG
ncbi:MAG TPA: ABC transporter ATP-binding protein [Puia sp.]|nr:ABC transporter ATP-binding protein [Puia sp.]